MLITIDQSQSLRTSAIFSCFLVVFPTQAQASNSCVHMFQVYEVVPCLSDCGQYIWVAEPWSVWRVSNVDLRDNCGEGVQTRKVR